MTSMNIVFIRGKEINWKGYKYYEKELEVHFIVKMILN